MVSVFILTYGAVFAAEIVGDKLLYTTGVLAARYRAMPIAFGATLAFMVKMGVAVMGRQGDLGTASNPGGRRHNHRLSVGSVHRLA